MSTIRIGFWQELLTRVGEIRQDNEFETDAGTTVFLGGTPELGPDDPDAAVAIVADEDHVTFDTKKTGIQLQFELQAVVKVTRGVEAWMLAELLAGDIKRAVETTGEGQQRLCGFPFKRVQTRTLEREPGSNVTGIAIRYQVDYHEAWGNP